MAKAAPKSNTETARKGNNMSNTSDIDLINELGLGSSASTEAPAETVEATEAEPAGRAPRSEIKIVNKPQVAVGLLPARVAFGGGNTGKRGSKYPFEELTEPQKDAEGNVVGYSFFEVKLADVENADAKKLQAAVQAAVAAQNKQAKAAGEGVKYVSRTLLGEQNEYVGTAVYRVDDTLGDDD